MNIVTSEREFEIVENLIRLGSKKEVANDMNLSLYTIETTIKNVYDKLGLNKISDLTLWFCAVKFNIADQVTAFKGSIITLVFLFVIHGLSDTQFRVRLFRRFESQTTDVAQVRLRGKRKSRSVIHFRQLVTISVT